MKSWMRKVLLAVVPALMTGGAFAYAEDEEEIPLSKVPKEVLDAAEKAVPGITLTEVEMEKTAKGVVYEVEGTKDGKEYEIEISADGKVLEVEDENDEDKDEKDDDDDKNEKDDD